MATINVPGEEEFKQWTREIIKEELTMMLAELKRFLQPEFEPLLTREEIAAFMRISLVTLHERQKRGLPYQKDRRRVVFRKSEVIKWMHANNANGQYDSILLDVMGKSVDNEVSTNSRTPQQ